MRLGTAVLLSALPVPPSAGARNGFRLMPSLGEAAEGAPGIGKPLMTLLMSPRRSLSLLPVKVVTTVVSVPPSAKARFSNTRSRVMTGF